MKTKTVTKAKRTVQKLQDTTQQMSEEDIINAIDQHGKIEEKIEALKIKHLLELQTKIDVLTQKYINPLLLKQDGIYKDLLGTLTKNLGKNEKKKVTQADIYEATLSKKVSVPLLPEKVFAKIPKNKFFSIIKVIKKDAGNIMTKIDIAKCEGKAGKPSISLKITKIK